MRKRRWETLGELEEDKPDDKQIVASDLDEDVVVPEKAAVGETLESSFGAVGSLDRTTDLESGDGGAATEKSDDRDRSDDDVANEEEGGEEEPAVLSQPFAELPKLPTGCCC